MNLPVMVQPGDKPGVITLDHPDVSAGSIPVLIIEGELLARAPGDVVLAGIVANPISGGINSPLWIAWDHGIFIARAALGKAAKKPDKKAVRLRFKHHCLRCGYNWESYTPHPKNCASKKCVSPYWERPYVNPKYLGKEK